MSTTNRLFEDLNYETISPLPSPPGTSVTTIDNDAISTPDEAPSPIKREIDTPTAELISANAKRCREIIKEKNAILKQQKKIKGQTIEDAAAAKEEVLKETLVKLHKANGTIQPTELDDLYAEHVYYMKYYYLIGHDPEIKDKELLKKWFQLFRGYVKEWHINSGIAFDPIVNYWDQDRDYHDESYQYNSPSSAIRFRQRIDDILGFIPNRYAMLFFDKFDFDAHYPKLF
jgi:hypothetical protein